LRGCVVSSSQGALSFLTEFPGLVDALTPIKSGSLQHSDRPARLQGVSWDLLGKTGILGPGRKLVSGPIIRSSRRERASGTVLEGGIGFFKKVPFRILGKWIREGQLSRRASWEKG